MTAGRIVVGYEGGDPSRDALRFGTVIAAAAGAQLTVVHAYSAAHGSDENRMALRAAATRCLADAEASLPYGARAELRTVESRSVVQGLHDFAEAEGADLIVLGSSRKGSLELHAVGTVAERLLRASPCSVAVAPRGYAQEENPALRVIGVAYDGSPEAKQALTAAAELARAAKSAIKLIGVVEHPAPPAVGMTSMYAFPGTDESCRDAVHRSLELAAEALPHALRPEIIVADGDPAEAIVDRAGILSLLVMGSRGYGPLRRALLGSVSGPVLRNAPCPVLVVPRGAEAAGEAPAAAGLSA